MNKQKQDKNICLQLYFHKIEDKKEIICIKEYKKISNLRETINIKLYLLIYLHENQL